MLTCKILLLWEQLKDGEIDFWFSIKRSYQISQCICQSLSKNIESYGFGDTFIKSCHCLCYEFSCVPLQIYVQVLSSCTSKVTSVRNRVTAYVFR